MRILDLGCGTAKVKGALGLDRVKLPGVDVVANLADPRYPFADHTFDEIYLNDVIEHLPDTIATMEALYRIAKPGSKIIIRVVNWNCHFTAMDPTHLKAFTENTFDFFGKHPRSYYTHARFDVVKCDLQYNYTVEKVFLRKRRLLKFLSNYLCNILEGLNFELKTLKPNVDTTEIDRVPDHDLYGILRCPHCASLKLRKDGFHTGKLRRVSDHWLACQEDSCRRKYPIHEGVPILLPVDAEQWVKVPEDELPNWNPGGAAELNPPMH